MKKTMSHTPADLAEMPLPSVTGFFLQDTQTNSRGAKSATLISADTGKITFALGTQEGGTSTPFGASCYKDEESVRKTLDLRVDEHEAQFFRQLDAWALEYITTHSERLFKKALTKDQVAEHYRSPLTEKEGYQPLVRCKITTAGLSAARVWNTEKQRIGLPEDLRGCCLVAAVHLSHLWVMGRDFGWVINVTDLQILSEDARECPF
jgi:hypothetical protein